MGGGGGIRPVQYEYGLLARAYDLLARAILTGLGGE